MKPHIHAVISAKKYGGKPEDYYEVHNFFDSTKIAVPDHRHRAFLHNAYGIFLLEKVFGVTITNSDGDKVSVRDLGEDHVAQDLGFIPTLEECFNALHNRDTEWLSGTRKKNPTVRRIELD
jgi:hypothetical protein